ncbi:hypothetical protein FBR02_13725 [Anaerolineae bacterium CFX9]|nr:MAG: hypothetical protein UZ13_03073 [Chloroflexi bacterium OLB13]MBV6437575.1 hypothetical protein [Anaerolineae bacterium]MDL1901819.1 hypothetical protein [Anaerolineae bacterium CFX9]NOG48776.1 hypothetical protein [Chloroflexota bacterium]GIK28183.1 MAG: hypothetical protein BroJett007_13210 [Chloroflexota bacterium]
MPPKTTATAPWQELETQAYHAYREWHLWLVLRERELADRLAVGRTDKRAPGAAPAAERPERKTTAHEGVTE